MPWEEEAFGSVVGLIFRFRYNKACIVFSHLGAQRAIDNDSMYVYNATNLQI
jgi:hypothetical protein